MARYKRKKSRRSGSKKLPLAIVAPMVAVGYDIGKYAMKGDMVNTTFMLTGVNANGNLEAKQLVKTYGPILAGVVVHKAAAKFGVNRMIPKWLPVSI